MSAIIRIDQAANSIPTGTAGKARNDIWKDQVVSLVSTGDATCTWTLLDKPPGSASALSAGSGTPVTITPDTYGTYRVKLVDSAGNVRVRVFRVRYNSAGVLAQRGWAKPALFETYSSDGVDEANYGTNTRGWDEPERFKEDDVRKSLDKLDASLAAVEIPFVVGEQICEKHAFERVGARTIDMSRFPQVTGLTRTVKFIVDMAKSGLATNAEIKLFNVTDNEDVTGTDLTETSSSTNEQSATLTVGAAAGDLRDDHPAMYAVYLKMNGGTEDTDLVSCSNARVEVSYA